LGWTNGLLSYVGDSISSHFGKDFEAHI
jgi:hypothetical protein